MRTLKNCFTHLAILIAFLGASAAFAAARVLVPGIDIGGEDTKIQVPGLPIVEVYRSKIAYPQTEAFDRYIFELNYGTHELDDYSRVDSNRLRGLSAREKQPILDLAEWIIDNEPIGYSSQVVGQFISIPEGLPILLRPGFTRYERITDVLGTVGGGPPYIPGVYLPGKGWVVPFPALSPGIKEAMVIAFDRSNHRRIRVFVFSMGTRRGEGTQFVPYQFAVKPAKDRHEVPFDVHSLSLYDLAERYSQGLIPAYTQIQGDQSSTQVFRGQSDREVQTDQDEQIAPDSRPSNGAIERGAMGYQEILVEILDEYGNSIQEEIPVEAYSWDPNRGVKRDVFGVQGPTRRRMLWGEKYWVKTPKGYVLEGVEGEPEVEVDGISTVMRSPDEKGEVVFRFRRVPTRKNDSAPQSNRVILPSRSRISASRPKSREVAVRVDPRYLGNQKLPITYMVKGRPYKTVRLHRGHTNVVESFTDASNVTIRLSPKDQKKWAVRKADLGGMKRFTLQPAKAATKGRKR